MGTDSGNRSIGAPLWAVEQNKLTHLREVFLDNTAASDAGLAHLKGLTRLRVLHLAGTQVTDFAVHEVQLALPQLTIYYWVSDRPIP